MDKKEKKNLLVFGYGLAVICAFWGLRLWFKYGVSPSKIIFLILSVALILLTLFRLDMLKVIYTYWMKAAHFIGEIISAVILTTTYYLLFSSIGIAMRLLGKDLLGIKGSKEVNSYWIETDPDRMSPEHFEKQF